MLNLLAILVLLVLDVLAQSFQQFVSGSLPNSRIRFIQNSGVCETTPGVQTFSGYIDIGNDMSMWFWFFESRTSPETAPFTLWLNGGPGCSSMIGLFQEHGPCKVNSAGTATTLNRFSWNQVSNVLYLDQPIGTGFSFGKSNVNSTFTAAPVVWSAFQIFFESELFHKYESREFIFATESYGGHYGPEFVTYFDQQNLAIHERRITGEIITVSALMINNGWYDPLIQNEAYVTFATNAPGYGPLVNKTVVQQLNQAFFGPGGCKEQEEACLNAGDSPKSNTICSNADDFCVSNVFGPAIGDRDPDDLREPGNNSPFPSESYVTFLQNSAIEKRIGALVTYQECSTPSFEKFLPTGDDARTLLPQLSALVNSGLKTLIWAGDADINCNWLGAQASVLAMEWFGKKQLNRTPLKTMTMRGVPVAQIQNVENFSFARIFGAGHEVPAYTPELALEIFKQVIAMEPLHSF